MSKDMMTQAINKVTIVGKLLDATFAKGNTKDGKPYERANITVRVTQKNGNRTETSDIPASAFATQFTSKGAPNPAYESLQRLKDLKTAQNVGIDNADYIRLAGNAVGNLRENAFVSKSGQLVTGWQINFSFFNTGKAEETATFWNELFIMDMKEEVDREGDTTGRLIIKGGIVQYGGNLDVMEFVVEEPSCVNFLTNNLEVNQTMILGGRIRYTTVEEVSASSGSWGEEVAASNTKTVRELVISGGDEGPKDEEFSYDPVEVKKAFNVRKAKMDQMMLNAKNKGTIPPVEKKPSLGSWE